MNEVDYNNMLKFVKAHVGCEVKKTEPKSKIYTSPTIQEMLSALKEADLDGKYSEIHPILEAIDRKIEDLTMKFKDHHHIDNWPHH